MEPEIDRGPEIPNDGHGAQIAAVIFASVICAIVAYVFGFSQNVNLNKPNAGLSLDDTKTTIQHFDPFDSVLIHAQSAYVWDVKNQKAIFKKNAGVVLPLASITKIMMANVASEILTSTTTVTIGKKDLNQEGDNGLFLYEQWNFTKLLDFTLAVSSNDGATALASTVGPDFVEKMNEKARSLGLSTMRFYNPTGLDVSQTQSGGYGSAIEVAKLFEYTLQYHPNVFGATRYGKFVTYSLNNFKHTAVNTDAEINNIPGIIGSKTGYSDLAGGNLAVVYDASVNYPIIVVVLGSTYNKRFTDITTLIRATNQTLSLQK